MTDAPDSESSARFTEFLRSCGDVGEDILRKHWSATSLGALETWDPSLRATIRLVLKSRQPIVFFWGSDLLQFFNEAYRPILDGMPADPIGAPFRTYWAEVFEGVRPFFERAMAGEGTWFDDLPLRLTRNGETRQTYWTFSYSPLYDEGGAIAGFMNVVSETTRGVEDREGLARANTILALEYERTRAALDRQREAERRQRVLQRELSHRMKNTLAMVQAVVSQSLRHATSTADAALVASARIQALGRAQDMLTDASWEVADIRPVVEVSIAPHSDRPDRFVLDGPDAQLTAQQSMGIALAIHELATNATKYGALTRDEGRVFVSWSTGPQAAFHFEWREEGGPAVVPPTRRGFGSRLIERVVPGYFAGEARMDFRPAGIRFAFRGRLDTER